MATAKKKPNVYEAQNTYPDRNIKELATFPEISVKMKEIDTLMLLMPSKEDNVLITIFNAIAEFLRKRKDNIDDLKSHNFFDALLKMKFYMEHENVLVRRFALYLANAIIESQQVLQDYTTEQLTEIVELCLSYYVLETDDYCIEYLSVVINKSLEDPHVVLTVLPAAEYIDKLFTLTGALANPDTIYHSFEAIHKLLQVQKFEQMQEFASHPDFPIDRALCDLTNEFPEIRNAALKVIQLLVLDCSEHGLFQPNSRAQILLQRLTQLLCEITPAEESKEVVEVLALALRLERMVNMFFLLDLFEKLVQFLANDEKMPLLCKCKIISIFTEMGSYKQYLQRLDTAGVTQWFIDCLLNEEPAPSKHVLLGLLRLLKYPDSAIKIIAAYDEGLLERLFNLMLNTDVNIKTREQCSEFLNALILHSYHNTVQRMLVLNYPRLLEEIFIQPMALLSPDYVLSLLQTIEELAKFDEYRSQICSHTPLIQNIAILLKNSSSTAVLVINILRCLCMLIDEKPARDELLLNQIAGSLKRALQSLSNLVKAAATNFIMQTSRFPAYIAKYIEIRGVLEVLVMLQKHSFCVPTWSPSIDCILNKCPTLKFCIRNHLTFTDNTANSEFLVSKKKFEDFRKFQAILNEQCSPFWPILVTNYHRPFVPEEELMHVPLECLEKHEQLQNPSGWVYCLHPADDVLPIYLEHANEVLSELGLFENPEKMKRCVDFENLERRIRVIAEIVAEAMSFDLKVLDLNAPEECMRHTVNCHLKELRTQLHCNFIPLGLVRTGCQFERAVLFKTLADEIGLPCTLQRSVDGKILVNEVPLPVVTDRDIHCDKETLKYLPWRKLRPTHIVDLLYNVGDLYPLQSRQALQYLRLF